MELNGPDVFHVPLQREHALLDLIVPHLDEVIVSTTHEHGLRLVEVHAADRPIVILEFLEKALRPVVKQVDAAVVQ